MSWSNTTDGGKNLTNANGLAKTPPMGWVSWLQFGENINETLIMETIDAMDRFGLRKLGFKYVNLDDGWQRYKGERKDHPLEPDPVKFPNGMKNLAHYAHKRGFKLGIYSGPGQKTCAGYTGSEGHEAADAALFASWGIDHIKYDSCCSHETANVSTVQRVMRTMSEGLLATKRPIMFHACHCGWADTWKWAPFVGANHWRIGQDICDDFRYPGNRLDYFFDVLDLIDRNNQLVEYAGPGHWNDMDMMIVGLNGGSTFLPGMGASNIEYRTHFSMWAIMSSPLLLGADIRKLDFESLKTLSNKEIIDLNQDPLGKQARLQRDDGDLQVYGKPLVDGSYAVALLNRGHSTSEIKVDFRRDLGLDWKQYFVRDLWRHNTTGPQNSSYAIEVIPHEAKVLRLFQEDKKKPEPSGQEADDEDCEDEDWLRAKAGMGYTV